MAHALFIMATTTSHLNSSFPIARKIQSEGGKVTYLSSSDYKDYIIKQGFGFHLVESVPFGMGFEKALHQKSASYLDILIDKLSGIIYKKRDENLRSILNKLPFTHVYIDAFYATDYIVLAPVLKEKRIKVVFIQTMLSCFQSGAPPLNSGLITTNPALISASWAFYMTLKRIGNGLNYLRYFGRNDSSVVKNRIRMNSIANKHTFRSILPISFTDIREIITAPKAFEFTHHISLEHQVYFGNQIDMTRIELDVDVNAKRFIERIKLLPSDQRPCIIYISLGGWRENFKELVNQFLMKIVEVAKRSPQFMFAFSAKIDLSNVSVPDNLFLFQRVAQLEMLAVSSLFITHGGLNSVKEAIHFNVPLLVYPLDKDFDQPGNAARVVFHQLGLRGDIRKDTAEHILEKINQCLDSRYVSHISNFKKQMMVNPDQPFRALI